MKQYMWFSVKTFIGVAFCAVVLILILSSCTTYQAQALVQSDVTQQPRVTPSPTIIPSATIDYKSTAEVAQEQANIAQATADEARRINALATTEYMSLVNEQLRMTAEIDRQEFEILMITATMAATSIPLTQTQQAVINTQIPSHETQVAAVMTATEHAPTQVVAMLEARNYETFGELDYAVRIFATGAIGIFAIGVVAFLFKRIPATEVDEPSEVEQLEPIKDTVVQMRTDKGGGSFSQTRFVIPCSPEQLTEFAEAITQGKKTMGINQWEGSGTLFTRPVILQLRSWARDNDFAASTEDNQLAPTNDFLDFLCAWLDKQRLPAEYEFQPSQPPLTPSPSMISA